SILTEKSHDLVVHPEVDGSSDKNGRATEQHRARIRSGLQPAKPLEISPRDGDGDRSRRCGGQIKHNSRGEVSSPENEDVWLACQGCGLPLCLARSQRAASLFCAVRSPT